MPRFAANAPYYANANQIFFKLLDNSFLTSRQSFHNRYLDTFAAKLAVITGVLLQYLKIDLVKNSSRQANRA